MSITVSKSSRILIWLIIALVAFAVLTDLPTALGDAINLRDAQSHRFDATSGQLAWYKLGKDVLAVLIIATVAYRLVRSHRVPLAKKPLVLTWLLLLSICTFALVHSGLVHIPLIAIVGAREMMPILVFVAGLWLSDRDVEKLCHAVGIMAIVESIVGAAEFAIGFAYLGVSIGYRVTGTFFDPNTYGLFGIACIALLTFQKRSKLWYFYLISAIVIILTSGSRSGFTILMLWLPIYAFLELRSVAGRVLLLILAGPMLFLIPFAAQSWAQRGGSYFENFESRDERYGILAGYLQRSSGAELIIGQGLGVASNMLLGQGAEPRQIFGQSASLQFVTDSEYTATLVQGGLLLVFALFGFITSPWIALKGTTIYPTARWLVPLIAILSSISLNIVEAAPFNYLIFILYGILARETEICKLSGMSLPSGGEMQWNLSRALRSSEILRTQGSR